MPRNYPGTTPNFASALARRAKNMIEDAPSALRAQLSAALPVIQNILHFPLEMPSLLL